MWSGYQKSLLLLDASNKYRSARLSLSSLMQASILIRPCLSTNLLKIYWLYSKPQRNGTMSRPLLSNQKQWRRQRVCDLVSPSKQHNYALSKSKIALKEALVCLKFRQNPLMSLFVFSLEPSLCIFIFFSIRIRPSNKYQKSETFAASQSICLNSGVGPHMIACANLFFYKQQRTLFPEFPKQKIQINNSRIS